MFCPRCKEVSNMPKFIYFGGSKRRSKLKHQPMKVVALKLMNLHKIGCLDINCIKKLFLISHYKAFHANFDCAYDCSDDLRFVGNVYILPGAVF